MSVKDDKINIKLELLKDNFSKKFIIITHFNQDAPNVKKDKEGFIWIPTTEERELINDAFNLITLDNSFNKIKPLSQNIENAEKLILPSQIDVKNKQKTYENNSEINKGPDIFNIIKKDLKTENIKRDNSSYYENINQRLFEKKSRYLGINDKYEDEKKFVEIDSNVIEKSLQKNRIKDDNYKDENEQTIIDRVLYQKKKEKLIKR